MWEDASDATVARLLQQQEEAQFYAVSSDGVTAHQLAGEYQQEVTKESEALARRLEEEEKKKAAEAFVPQGDWAVSDYYPTVGASHPLYRRIKEEIPYSTFAKAQDFLTSVRECNDWDVHKFNKEKIAPVGMDKILFNEILPTLNIEPQDDSVTKEVIRKTAAEIYGTNEAKIKTIDAFLTKFQASSTTNADGLENRNVSQAVSQIYQLALQADEALQKGRAWTRIFLDKAAENIETAGGCLPGIMGRLVEIGTRIYNNLAEVAYTMPSPTSQVAPSALGSGVEEEIPAEAFIPPVAVPATPSFDTSTDAGQAAKMVWDELQINVLGDEAIAKKLKDIKSLNPYDLKQSFMNALFRDGLLASYFN